MTTDYNPFSLSGKTILVTGASSGIGRQTAIECARLGANVVATARNKMRLQETLAQMPQGQNILLTADLSDEEQIQQLVSAIPNVDGVAFCAGVVNELRPVNFIKKNELDRVISINTTAPILLTRLLLKNKKLKTPSSIVYVSSLSGIKVIKGNAVYSASKAALDAFAKTAALELAPRHIRVNTVNPGLVLTPMTETEAEVDRQQFEKEISNRYPLGRAGTAKEVAHAITFLLSDASSWTTGINLIVDGGRSLC